VTKRTRLCDIRHTELRPPRTQDSEPAPEDPSLALTTCFPRRAPAGSSYPSNIEVKYEFFLIYPKRQPDLAAVLRFGPLDLSNRNATVVALQCPPEGGRYMMQDRVLIQTLV